MVSQFFGSLWILQKSVLLSSGGGGGGGSRDTPKCQWLDSAKQTMKLLAADQAIEALAGARLARFAEMRLEVGMQHGGLALLWSDLF